MLPYKQIFGKDHNLVEISPFQAQIFDISYQKLRKGRYQSFLFLSSFALFFYFISNILSKIVDTYSTK